MDKNEALKVLENLEPEKALDALLAWGALFSQEENKPNNEISSELIARMIIGLRENGLEEKQINDLLLWMNTGEEQYLPHK